MNGNQLKTTITECPESVLMTILEISDEEGLKLIESLHEIEYDWNQSYSLGIFEEVRFIDCVCMRNTPILLHALLNNHQLLSTHTIHEYTACYYYAVHANSISILQELQSQSISLITPKNQTLLHLIATYCYSPAVHAFISYAISLGLDLNGQDEEGKSLF